MQLAEHILYVLLGFVFLTKSADVLITGAVSLGKRLGLSSLVIGLTIVAFGTSAPELATSLIAAFHGKADIAVGNVIGSNICNVALILGIAAALAPLTVSLIVLKRDLPVMLGVSFLFLIFLNNGNISQFEGLILVLILMVYLYFLKRYPGEMLPSPAEIDAEEDKEKLGIGWSSLLVVMGTSGLALGADWLVNGAAGIAELLQIPQSVIGLTLIALGTSLPELATTIIALTRKKYDIGVGNIIGSNIFNILMVIGATSLIQPLNVELRFIEFDGVIMFLLSVMVFPLGIAKMKINRLTGIFFLISYGVYIWMVYR